MALMTKTRLWSRTTPARYNVKQPRLGKKRTKNKRRRVANACAVDDSGEREDACDDLYVAAQAQMEQEMKAAGLGGSLPMCFGSTLTTKTLRKHKRPLEEIAEQVLDEEREDEMESGEETVIVDSTEAKRGEEVAAREEEEEQIHGVESLITETVTADKMRVVYDSDGEVAERVVENVEVGSAVKLEEPSDRRIACKSSSGGKKKNKYPVLADVVKFYLQRHILFEKFEDGIQLDHESWYSVTPQVVAEHIATRLGCDIIVDPFAGCGGNVIQLAMTCKHVIAIDIDPEKIRMAKHNATIYGVAEKIEWIVGNSIDILPSLQADAVFLSPPWGGLTYNRKDFRLEDMLVKGVSGSDLFARVRTVSKNIAYYLPRGTVISDLEALTPGEPVECERVFLNKQLKVLMAYYGDLVAPKSQVEEENSLPIEDTGTYDESN